tara:strand:+ start:205 stop:378 length:174 start_codon:yes stop_codon:yes gene_type:complete
MEILILGIYFVLVVGLPLLIFVAAPLMAMDMGTMLYEKYKERARSEDSEDSEASLFL